MYQLFISGLPTQFKAAIFVIIAFIGGSILYLFSRFLFNRKYYVSEDEKIDLILEKFLKYRNLKSINLFVSDKVLSDIVSKGSGFVLQRDTKQLYDLLHDENRKMFSIGIVNLKTFGGKSGDKQETVPCFLENIDYSESVLVKNSKGKESKGGWYFRLSVVPEYILSSLENE